eukprot:13709459-Alexandrium_andersonii.AAC.1
MGDTLAEPRNPARWLADMSAAGSGTQNADMPTIRPLRQKIWQQTQEAVLSDLSRDVPAVT